MEEKNKKVKRAMFVVFLVLFAMLCGVCICAWRSRAIASYETKIEKSSKSFEQGKRKEKLEVYQDIQAKYDKYQKSICVNKDTTKKFHVELETMKKYFLADYDKVIKENTIEATQTEDKETLKTASVNLSSALSKISREEVCTKKETASYKKKIKKLTNAYAQRVTEIETAEAAVSEQQAAQEQAIAEQQAAEESARQQEAEQQRVAEETKKAQQAAERQQREQQVASQTTTTYVPREQYYWYDTWQVDGNGNEIPGTRERYVGTYQEYCNMVDLCGGYVYLE